MVTYKKHKLIHKNSIIDMYNEVKNYISSIIHTLSHTHLIVKKSHKFMNLKPHVSFTTRSNIFFYTALQKPYFFLIISILYNVMLNQSVALCDNNDYIPEFIQKTAWLLVSEYSPTSATEDVQHIPQVIRDTAWLTVNTSSGNDTISTTTVSVPPSLPGTTEGHHSFQNMILSLKDQLGDNLSPDILAYKVNSFMLREFPNELLVTNLHDLNDSNSLISNLFKQPCESLNFDDKKTAIAHFSLNIAVRIYNTIIIQNPDYTPEEFRQAFQHTFCTRYNAFYKYMVS